MNSRKIRFDERFFIEIRDDRPRGYIKYLLVDESGNVIEQYRGLSENLKYALGIFYMKCFENLVKNGFLPSYRNKAGFWRAAELKEDSIFEAIEDVLSDDTEEITNSKSYKVFSSQFIK